MLEKSFELLVGVYSAARILFVRQMLQTTLGYIQEKC